MAARSKFTTRNRAAILGAVEKGHSFKSAAAIGGINKQTLYNWLEKARKQPSGQYGKFAEDLERASAKAVDRAIAAIREHMPDDWRAAMEFLSRRFPDEWAKRERHEVSGPKGEPIRVEVKWPSNERQTIRVVSITTEEEFLDLGAEEFSLGDVFVFSSNLLKGGKQVGHLGGVCTITSLEREEAQCVATAWFRGGQITVQGLIAGEPQTFVLPITGGSGKFEGAEGVVHSRQVSDTREILTFRLSD